MFNLFKGEIRKTVKKRTILGFSITFVAVLVLVAILFNFMMKLIEDVTSSDEFSDMMEEMEGMEGIDMGDIEFLQNEFYTTGYLSEKELREMIVVVKERYAKIEKAYSENKKANYADFYEVKSELAVLEYALENGYYDKPVYILGMNCEALSGISEKGSAESFVGLYSAIIAIIVLIYGIVTGAGLYTNEYKSGTIKLLMVRPITKNRLTSAKLLSMLSLLTVMYLVPTFIGFIYSAIVYGTDASVPVLYSFNGAFASEGTIGGMSFGTVFAQWVQILVLATVSFSVGTITKKTNVGIIVAMVIMLGIADMLSGFGINAFLLSTSLDFMAYFGVNSSVPTYGNFFIALAVSVIWTATLVVALYLVTNKRDVV